jgi:hypothetical protein
MKMPPFGKRLHLAFAIIALTATPVLHAQQGRAKFVADENGVYRVDAKGKRHLIVKHQRNEIFMDNMFSVSPNREWALIDYVEDHPGPGRTEEVRILISLKKSMRINAERLKKRYGEWLDEVAEWDLHAPSTINLGSGAKIVLTDPSDI